MKFIDLNRQYGEIRKTVLEKIEVFLDSGNYILGKEITTLEDSLAKYVGTKYCISCSSGTDALLMCLMAWDISDNDVVFTTPFTFNSTAEVINLVKAKPVFVDIDKKTFNIDPEKLEESIKKTISENKSKPKAIISVDLFGLCANYKEIEKIAKKYNLLLLEDAAQAFGATINNKVAGSFGNAATTSFFPAKPLGCYGDGGAIFVDNDDLYKKLLSIRVHGQGANKYENINIGINGRMDTIQAVILLEKLKIFDNELNMRQIVAKQYSDKLKKYVQIPHIPKNYKSSWAQFSILLDDNNIRTQIMKELNKIDIPTGVYYSLPLHLQKVYENLNYKIGDFKISEDISKRILQLPMHPYLKDNEINLITDNLIKILNSK